MKRNPTKLIVALFVLAAPQFILGQTNHKPKGNVHIDEDPIPKLTFLYPAPFGTVFDRTCSQFLNTEIKPEWQQETVRRLPEFQAQWDREGPRYLSVTFAEIGLRFPYREMQAVLTVCPVSTMSMPLMINVGSFLSTAQNPARPEFFSEVVFHELMHHYVSPVFVISALRKKYEKEPSVTLYHLHVMALEKFALLKLRKTTELKYLDYLYRTDPPPSYYKRAWEIVNNIEGYEAFIKELKSVGSNQRVKRRVLSDLYRT